MDRIIYRLLLIYAIIFPLVNSAEVPKCCKQGFASSQNCTLSNNTLVNPYKPTNGQKSIYQPLDCGEEGTYNLDPENSPEWDKYILLDNSSLFLLKPQIMLPPEKYCMELIESLGKILPFLCFDKEDEVEIKGTDQAMRIYSVGMLISIPCLLATFLVYLLVRELHTLHGRCLTSHVFSLLMSYLCLGLLQRYTAVFDESVCTAMGFSVQYFFLATFFWLNVMCIDIYWAFSSVRSRGRHPGGDKRKLLLYSLYAWGMPLLILLITVAVDFSNVPKTSPFKPNFGTTKCFFEGRPAAYIYFYGPMALLICGNMVLFGITAYRIWSTSRETAALNRGDSRRHSDKQENERFKLYVKLFLVMGINWVAELISFIVGEGVPHYLWYVTDLTNTLQGVFIFVIFVWKRRVRRLVWDRLSMMSGRTHISRSRGGTSSDATTSTKWRRTKLELA